MCGQERMHASSTNNGLRLAAGGWTRPRYTWPSSMKWMRRWVVGRGQGGVLAAANHTMSLPLAPPWHLPAPPGTSWHLLAHPPPPLGTHTPWHAPPGTYTPGTHTPGTPPGTHTSTGQCLPLTPARPGPQAIQLQVAMAVSLSEEAQGLAAHQASSCCKPCAPWPAGHPAAGGHGCVAVRERRARQG